MSRNLISQGMGELGEVGGMNKNKIANTNEKCYYRYQEEQSWANLNKNQTEKNEHFKASSKRFRGQ